MKKVEVLIVVDAASALSSRDLQSNVYLIDTNKYVGSGNEGQAELKTACSDGQIIVWRVVSVSPDNEVDITSFTGQMVNDHVCEPKEEGLSYDKFWEGRVEAQGQASTQQYSVVLSIDGSSMTFDPFLIISV
ncbi:MAG: hypothetical protein HQL71_10580 [Magnetococcales bacterium]|nr:hypothetical protein [Magnetococcales bacterium]